MLDPDSPCGNVHIRNKTAVGTRMALASRAIAYNASVAHTGPLVRAITIASGSMGTPTITVEFTVGVHLASINQTREGDTNFEVTYDPTLVNGWIPATPSAAQASIKEQVVLTPSGGHSGRLTGVRYAWTGVPSGGFIYGDGDRLPSAPFIAACGAEACDLVPPGHLPATL